MVKVVFPLESSNKIINSIQNLLLNPQVLVNQQNQAVKVFSNQIMQHETLDIAFQKYLNSGL